MVNSVANGVITHPMYAFGNTKNSTIPAMYPTNQRINPQKNEEVILSFIGIHPLYYTHHTKRYSILALICDINHKYDIVTKEIYLFGGKPMAQKITPFLWFNKNCEEAVKYYVAVFNGSPYSKHNSKINFIQRYEKGIDTPGAQEMEGKVLTTEFELNGQTFQALDGGPIFTFNESISLLVDCQDQKEVDYFWDKLSAVPASEQCGWCKDKFGLSWQIIPRQLGELLSNPDKKIAHKVANAMLQMHKIVVADLEKAATT